MTTTTRHEQHSERGTERGRGTGSHLLWAFVALTAYVLSVGPAAALHYKTTNPGLKTVLEFVYAPAIFVIEKTPLKPVGTWWIALWFRLVLDVEHRPAPPDQGARGGTTASFDGSEV